MKKTIYLNIVIMFTVFTWFKLFVNIIKLKISIDNVINNIIIRLYIHIILTYCSLKLYLFKKCLNLLLSLNESRNIWSINIHVFAEAREFIQVAHNHNQINLFTIVTIGTRYTFKSPLISAENYFHHFLIYEIFIFNFIRYYHGYVAKVETAVFLYNFSIYLIRDVVYIF